MYDRTPSWTEFTCDSDFFQLKKKFKKKEKKDFNKNSSE